MILVVKVINAFLTRCWIACFSLVLGAGFLSFAENYQGNTGALSEIASVKQIERLIETDGKVHSIEDLLRALPEVLRGSPVFIYRSQSLQGASYENPRVLLSDRTGRLVLAFNGNAQQEGFNKIEAMEFDETALKFKFYELEFDAKGKFNVLGPNPEKCLSCHRVSDPRPNWESYDQWPGVYGGNDDRLRNEEVEPFKDFLRHFETDPRYSSLKIEELKKVLGCTNFFGRLPNEPNISFTHRLSQNNFKRVARLIIESPNYNHFKFVIGGYLSGKAGIGFRAEGLLPSELSGITRYYSEQNILEAKLIAVSYANAYSYPGTLAFRSLFESRGIDTSDWFMNFKGGMTNTFVNGVPWEDQLLEVLLERDLELKLCLFDGSTFQLNEVKLMEASEEKFSKQKPSVSLRTYDSDSEVAKRIWRDSCQQCHERKDRNRIPQFDFEKARKNLKFREFIESGAMPKNQKLTPSQKIHLLKSY